MSKEIKCVIWDLDETIWSGILLESDQVMLRPGIENVIKTLDERGILQSISSKNDHQSAMEKLSEFDILQYFLYPKINWNAKSSSIKQIQEELNIGMDTILFIDDQIFEIEEVKSVYPEVEFMQHWNAEEILSDPKLNPRFITVDSIRRRQIYLEDIQRKKDEESYQGPKESFLSGLDMRFTISQASEGDLARAAELTVRTNQLNATGVTYEYDELNAFRTSPSHKLYICELSDKYGSYGKIGLALVECSEKAIHLKLLLMSCRVISRGVGTVLLSYIMKNAKLEGKLLFADFKKTDRNKLMYITYKLANFKELSSNEAGKLTMRNDLSVIQQYPEYIQVIER
ncbi:HAD-IIIC family phosphatase [Paenibacillus pabuli]|uniref:HAD-IIIC family phosphatase n=1 Tax=Paenibacillus pabuli TaxID=1472 RepID=UPI003CE97D10